MPTIELIKYSFVPHHQHGRRASQELGTSNEEEMPVELTDSIHDISKYTVVVNSALEFTVFVFHWPVPDENPLYEENKHHCLHVALRS